MRSVTTTLPGHPASVPTARRWAVTTMEAWGMPETGWTAAQVVSELATNCTLHARCDFSVRLTVEGQCVRVEAVDGSPVGLQARQYSSTATTGRGLRIVESLSTSWGVVADGAGKAVWALLAIEDRVDLSPEADEEPGSTSAGPRIAAQPTGPVALSVAA